MRDIIIRLVAVYLIYLLPIVLVPLPEIFEEGRSKQRNKLPKSQREKSQDELSCDLGSKDPFSCPLNSMELILLNIFLVIKYLDSCLPT